MSNYIPLQTAKYVIISALTDLDSELGMRAKDILTDDIRTNIHPPREDSKHTMMACRPAGISAQTWCRSWH